MAAVMAPMPSTLMRHESIKVEVVIAGLSSGSNDGVAAGRLEAGGDADAGELAFAAQPVALLFQLLVIRVGQHLVDHGVVVAAVVGGAARDHVGKFVAADHVAPAHFQPVEAEHVRRPRP